MNVRPSNVGLTNIFKTISKSAVKVKNRVTKLFQKVQESKAAGHLREVGKAVRNPDLPGAGKAAALFEQVFGKSVSKDSSEIEIDQKVGSAMKLLQSKRKLDSGQEREIRQQLAEGFKYITKEKVDGVKGEDNAVYIRDLTKGPASDKNAKYKGSHIQINPDGKVYIIPKNPELWLGKGGFKKVRIAIELDEELNPKQVVAFASLKISGGKEGQIWKGVQNEVKLVKEFLETDEKEGVNVFAFDPGQVSEKKGPKAKMILPYANFGDLKGKKFEGQQQADVVRGCCKWIQSMHDENYVNRDIKPENFLGFKDDGEKITVKCMDLGLATKASRRFKSRSGTPGFMAPEIFREKTFDSKQADIFSLGATLYCLQTGRRSCPIISKATKLKKGRWSVEVMTLQKGWNKLQPTTKLQLLTKEMMNPNPALRPNIDQVNQLLESVYNDDVSFDDFQKAMVKNAVEGLCYNATTPGYDKLQKNGDMLIRISSQSTPEKPVYTLDYRITTLSKGSYRFEIKDGGIHVTNTHPPKVYETMEALIESIGGKRFIQPLEKEVQALCHNTQTLSHDKLQKDGDMLIRMSSQTSEENPVYTLDFKTSLFPKGSSRFEIKDDKIYVTSPQPPKVYNTIEAFIESVGGHSFIKPEK